MHRIIGEFTPQKTSDVFKSVEFTYGDYIWEGVIPKKIEHQGLEVTDDEINEKLSYFHEQLNPTKKGEWTASTDGEWSDKEKKSQTYKVLNALYSGEWECRLCKKARSV